MATENFRSFWRVLLTLSSAGALFLLSLIACNSGSQDSQEELAGTDSAETIVSALGRLEPLGEVISVGVALGHRLGRLEVVESQKVQPGQVLAYLDTYPERLADQAYSAR